MNEPNDEAAHEAANTFNQANAAFRAQDWATALASFEAALALQPSLEPAALQAARCLVRLARWMDAREAFARTLRLNPANYSAWLEAGHLCRQMGELGQAVAAYRRAMDVAPERYEAPLAAARCLELQGDFGAAQAAYEQALQAAARKDAALPRAVHWHMAAYRLERGDAARALQSLRAALAAASTDGASADDVADIQTELGEALMRLGRRDEALALFTAASAATSEATLTRLSERAFRHNLWQEALAVLQRCLELHPGSAQAHWNLAHLQAECWQLDEAEAMLQRAEAMAPMPGATSMRASIAGRRGDADTALALYRQLAQAPDAAPTAASSAAMSALYSDRLDAQAVAQLHRTLFAPLGRGARARGSFKRAPLVGRRIRLGIVSADFHHQHPVNIFMQPVLRELDRSRFETFLYFTGPSRDDQTQLARSRVEHWREAATFNDVQLARQIDADAIDLLLDLAGHTGQQRMRLFAQRAAPVQATYLGYPGSTGVPNVDWLLGDAVVTPPGCEALCSEAVARLPGTVFCFAPEVDYPYPAYGAAHARRPLTFGSFNNVPKLTPRTLRLWARILAAVPGSRLLLKAPSFGDAGAVRLFTQRLQGLGVDPARLEFRGPTGLTDMMAEYADVDIALDPLPYNGGTTSLQALWMGVPVLTLEGAHFVSRMGASFMRAAGLDDWVAGDDEAYVAMAVAKAADRTALLALKQGLRQRLAALPAWDARAHTRAMEQAFEAMVRGA
ncbi:O-linked N-acetylglucosamine transferase, SPINDLY family protein [Azohydromonas lata]|uniref:O-linked N-acetylglucosamine transferase, SPINDLY family protein n=1 Tax=Azohydromonas lata TaxID=45677 RepID=UPI00082CA914|nr:tetratricopeptide repeat protein [Azohydromonas lata]